MTLLELLVTLAIVATALAIIAPNFRTSGDKAQFQRTVRIIASALNDTRSHAIGRNHETVVTVNLQTKTILRNEAVIAMIDNDIDIDIVAATRESSGQHLAAFRFYPDGSSTGGDITLSQGEREAHISIDWLTGAVAQSERQRAP